MFSLLFTGYRVYYSSYFEISSIVIFYERECTLNGKTEGGRVRWRKHMHQIERNVYHMPIKQYWDGWRNNTNLVSWSHQNTENYIPNTKHTKHEQTRGKFLQNFVT